MIIVTDPKRSYAERVNSFFVDEFNKLERKRLEKYLNKVEGMPYEDLMRTQVLKRIDKDLYEIRIMFKTTNVRVFVALIDQKLFPLHVIKKKTNRIPSSDLEIVKQRFINLKFILRI